MINSLLIMDILVSNLLSFFQKKFGKEELIVRSPGRINIIGEHTDYNEGFVFPAAINREIYMVLKKTNLTRIRFYAYDYDDYYETDITHLPVSDKIWTNYLLGVAYELYQLNNNIKGFDCVFGGNIPLGAGMSSSAALENALSVGLNHLFGLNISKKDLAICGQKAEHNFVGTKCGIMDQYASIFGKRDHAMLLDCRTLEFQYYPVEMDQYELLIINSNVKHELASSEYNKRRQECEAGALKIQKNYPDVNSLRDVDHSMLQESEYELNENEYKRCKYVIEENLRTIRVAKALEEKNIQLMGKLLNQTHKGLSHLYEVSCDELDFLTNKALETSLVKGTRLMGGGFGGCTINIIEKESKEVIIQALKNPYESKFNRKLEGYSLSITEGTSILEDI